ncbi:mediator of RNA polymerase II transcription subunit 18 [Hydra vulgaris]|nr:mediator of RNA polymerase II transcription subunit 18 [Hydra vulgaris]
MNIQNKNQIQYILVGSVPASNFKFLLHRLKGLCDNAVLSETMYEDHEAIYIIKNQTSGAVTVSLSVKRSLLNPEKAHRIQYLGNVEGMNLNRAATMRSIIEVETSDNISTYLEQLGFQFDYETLLRGYSFYKGPMRINVSRLHKIPERGNLSNIMPMTDSYLVELTLHTLVQQDSLCEEMKAFAEHLKPIVVLDKIEQKR